MTPSIRPNSRTWTLRFKHHRTTVLLHVDPLQKLSSVRSELLQAVQQTHPDGTLNGHAIPETETDILLARPTDINDLSAGWELLERDDDLDNALEEQSSSKGKGKAGASKAKTSKDKLTDCPQGAGLRDGGVVAFKFRGQTELEDKERDEGIDVEEDEKLDGETLVGDPAAEKWDVVVPSMEETYGDGEGEGEDEELVPIPEPMNAK